MIYRTQNYPNITTGIQRRYLPLEGREPTSLMMIERRVDGMILCREGLLSMML